MLLAYFALLRNSCEKQETELSGACIHDYLVLYVLQELGLL